MPARARPVLLLAVLLAAPLVAATAPYVWHGEQRAGFLAKWDDVYRLQVYEGERVTIDLDWDLESSDLDLVVYGKELLGDVCYVPSHDMLECLQRQVLATCESYYYHYGGPGGTRETLVRVAPSTDNYVVRVLRHFAEEDTPYVLTITVEGADANERVERRDSSGSSLTFTNPRLEECRGRSY